MTNEWGPPLTGEEMKALKGRIDPDTWVRCEGGVARFGFWSFDTPSGYSFPPDHTDYSLPANHPYYKVREYNQKHGTNLVLHDGSDEAPADADGGDVLARSGNVFKAYRRWKHIGCDSDIIAYTPKPKESEVTKFDEKAVARLVAAAREFWEDDTHGILADALDKALEPFSALVPYENEAESEVTEQMPRDEAIEYVRKMIGSKVTPCYHRKFVAEGDEGSVMMDLCARLIQQYEPDRLKPAVDVAAEKYATSDGMFNPDHYQCFKAGAAWQKENGK